LGNLEFIPVFSNAGILSWDSNINTGDGDDTITGTALKNFGYFGTYGIRILGAW
jgi:hypothetical protein